MIAVERVGGHRLGSIRLASISSTTKETSSASSATTVAEGSTVLTDGLPTYRRLKGLGSTNRSNLQAVAHVELPGVHPLQQALAAAEEEPPHTQT
jgi:hypothetical protein